MEVRCGLHTGECELIADGFGGIASTSPRVSAARGADEVLVSSTVKDLVAGSGIEFTPRSQASLKGTPGPWSLFAVTSV